jgi:GxxExxY protein
MQFAPHIHMLADVPYNKTTGSIIEAAIEVHRTLGPGLLESSYTTCLHYELAHHALRFDSQRAVPIRYKDITLPSTYRIDLIVEDQIIVEIKSLDRLLPVHEAQLLTYLRMVNSPAGLLINFNVPRLLDGLSRVINPQYTGPGSANQ